MDFLGTKPGTVPTAAVIPYAGSSAPAGWLLCDGSAVSRTTYANLFALLSTTFGIGNGSTTFNVPDLRGRAPIGVGTGSGLTARALAATGGTETHQLTSAEMPAHTHTVNGYSSASVPAGSFIIGGSPGNTNYASGSTGGGGAHPNMQPWLGLNFIIKT